MFKFQNFRTLKLQISEAAELKNVELQMSRTPDLQISLVKLSRKPLKTSAVNHESIEPLSHLANDFPLMGRCPPGVWLAPYTTKLFDHQGATKVHIATSHILHAK